MLWDIIRDFFVTYIFGGYSSEEIAYDGFLGFLYNSYGGDTHYSTTFGFQIGNEVTSLSHNPLYMSIGDWLSTTFTIITLILICYMFLRLTIWLFKFGAGLFKW